MQVKVLHLKAKVQIYAMHILIKQIKEVKNEKNNNSWDSICNNS